jgi:hypothetical protein
VRLCPEVGLAFIARQLERLVNDVAGLKDDMTVVMAGSIGWMRRRTAW